MFVDKPIGDPLKRKQLKWLLVTLGAIMVVAVLVYVFMQNRLMDEDAQAPVGAVGKTTDISTKPTQEEIRKQLEVLAAEDAANPAPKPTQKETEKQLKALAKEDAGNSVPKPTQEDIQKQLEMLSKQ